MMAERYEKRRTKFYLVVENWRVVWYVVHVCGDGRRGLFMERGVIRIRLLYCDRVFKISSRLKIPTLNNSNSCRVPVFLWFQTCYFLNGFIDVSFLPAPYYTY